MPGNIFRATVLAVLFLIGTGAGAQEARTYVFGVLNQQSAIKTAERWNPILKLFDQPALLLNHQEHLFEYQCKGGFQLFFLVVTCN